MKLPPLLLPLLTILIYMIFTYLSGGSKPLLLLLLFSSCACSLPVYLYCKLQMRAAAAAAWGCAA